MLDLEGLKNDRELVGRIDWEITPQEVYEAYQIKSINAWKHRDLPDLYHFVIYVWKNEAQLVLSKKTYKDSEEIAGIDAPEALVRACLSAQAGDPVPQGQYAVTGGLKDWLRERLDVS